MYTKIRVDKLHPDGSRRAAWEAYRIEDRDGAVRLWTPPLTPRVHVNGRWRPESPFVTAWVPGEHFVVNYLEDAEGHGLYIDIVRDVEVTPRRFVYVDLYVDVLFYHGTVSTKDEDLLARLAPEESSRVLATRDELKRRVSAGEPPFLLGHPRWVVPDDARSLPPGAELTLS